MNSWNIENLVFNHLKGLLGSYITHSIPEHVLRFPTGGSRVHTIFARAPALQSVEFS